ncbi:MAG: Site-specific recombinase, resolvase family [uncultured Sulfurovum sp.]|uniref:Site-specific recombinase, resolvase family n=1 Tax=uncultured Sulfurovum sp. TaxID=269237 RepID=A0A6S6TH41_9BACT|nr:MAG: Site-specific recombinase, resolvase family [uncultured Sulfurovum sp.]
MIGVLSIIAEFETDLRAERQAEGIKSALERGVRFGAKWKMTKKQVEEAVSLQQIGEMTNQQIADSFGIGRSTLLRYLSNYKKSLSSSDIYC